VCGAVVQLKCKALNLKENSAMHQSKILVM
jgi:hypothetical protein